MLRWDRSDRVSCTGSSTATLVPVATAKTPCGQANAWGSVDIPSLAINCLADMAARTALPRLGSGDRDRPLPGDPGLHGSATARASHGSSVWPRSSEHPAEARASWLTLDRQPSSSRQFVSVSSARPHRRRAGEELPPPNPRHGSLHGRLGQLRVIKPSASTHPLESRGWVPPSPRCRDGPRRCGSNPYGPRLRRYLLGRDKCADWNIVIVDLAEEDILRLSGQRKASVSQEVDRHRRASIEAIQGHKPRRPNASASPAYCLVGNPSVCRGQP